MQKRKIILFLPCFFFLTCRRHCIFPFRINTSAFNGVAVFFLSPFAPHTASVASPHCTVCWWWHQWRKFIPFTSRARSHSSDLAPVCHSNITKFLGEACEQLASAISIFFHLPQRTYFHCCFFPSLFVAVVMGNTDRVHSFADGVDLCRAVHMLNKTFIIGIASGARTFSTNNTRGY